jgi:hypothetical protein
MQIPLFRQESYNIAVDTSAVFLSEFLTTFPITWVILTLKRGVIYCTELHDATSKITESSVCSLLEQV